MSRFRLALIAFLVLALVGAGCSSGGSSGPISGDDSGVNSAETTGPDDPESTAPSTTETIPVGAVAIPDLQIVLVEFGDSGFVEVANRGAEDVALDGIWLCQFPTYVDLGTIVAGGTIPAGESARIAAADIGGLGIAGGEAALYTAADFASPDAIFGFVQWGTGGARADVAVAAGIWPAGATVIPDPDFSSIELFGDPADVASWG